MKFWHDHSVLRLMALTFAISMGIWGWLEVSLRMLPQTATARATPDAAPPYISLADEAGESRAPESAPLRAAWSQFTR
ncbi:MAG: hypothetical protein SFV19_04865 [Rhodospirillaceae bacterium]|nr:hypothetical protein [Rhodospirillaceae bacterium]